MTAGLKAPQQKRSRKTLNRIVEAGLAILREVGPQGLTVQDVVARARTSVGSFYQRFAGKEELLSYLEDALVAEASAHFEERLAARVSPDLPLAARVHALIALMMAEPEVAAARGARGEAVVRALISSRREIGHPDPEIAIRIGFAAVSGALGDAPEKVGPAQLAPELGRLWLSYLRGGVEADPKGGAPDFFEVWG